MLRQTTIKIRLPSNYNEGATVYQTWSVAVDIKRPRYGYKDYADNLAVFSPFLKKGEIAAIDCFQKFPNDITPWASVNKIIVNAAMTKLLGPTYSEPKYAMPILMDNQPLDYVDQAKLLVFTVDQKLTFS